MMQIFISVNPFHLGRVIKIHERIFLYPTHPMHTAVQLYLDELSKR